MQSLKRPRGSLQERLMSKIVPEPNSGCWLWTGRRNNYGYGSLSRGPAKAGPIMAHRAAYEIFRGPIPVGLELDHLCRVPLCCNPAHLEPVTHRENLRRSPFRPTNGMELRTHCKNGHPYDDKNTRRWPSRKGSRDCVACRLDRRSKS